MWFESIGQEPLHLTDFKINNDELWLKGHSLMNGYLNKELMTFKEDYLIINALNKNSHFNYSLIQIKK